jgi:hypothetical protein
MGFAAVLHWAASRGNLKSQFDLVYIYELYNSVRKRAVEHR